MTDEQKQKIITWLEANPYQLYADYNTDIPVELVQKLLDGDTDKFWEAVSDIEHDALYYAYEYMQEECLRECEIERSSIDDDDFRELFNDYAGVCTKDYLKTAARNTRLNITATPYLGQAGDPIPYEEDQNEQLFQFPHHEKGETENARLRKQLSDVLGIEGFNEAEQMYPWDTLKVLGRLDIYDLIENGSPTHITFGPDDNYIVHNSVNGSGRCDDIKPTKTVTLPAIFAIDNNDPYGVQSVYSLVGEMWSRELHTSRPEAGVVAD